jgi:hypothetical protein
VAIVSLIIYREDFYFVDWFHGDQGAACHKMHMNFANESACLTGDNIQNEIVTIRRSQEVLKMLSLYTQISFTINCFIKKQMSNILLALTVHQTPTFTGWSRTSWVRCGFCELR